MTRYSFPQMGYRLGDLGGAGAAALGEPVSKAPARGSRGLPFRPGEYAICSRQLAGSCEQAKGARDALHLAISSGCMPPDKLFDDAPCLRKTILPISNQRLNECRTGCAEAGLGRIDHNARYRGSAIPGG